jgi:hypothetical protein
MVVQHCTGTVGLFLSVSLSDHAGLRIRIQRFILMRTRVRLSTSVRIRILLLIKVMEICDNWSINLLWLHLVRLQASIVSATAHRGSIFELLKLLKLLKFDWHADPDSAFHSNADPTRIQLLWYPDPLPWSDVTYENNLCAHFRSWRRSRASASKRLLTSSRPWIASPCSTGAFSSTFLASSRYVSFLQNVLCHIRFLLVS